MTDKKTNLREQAEGKVAQLLENIESPSLEETQQILHELRVHQIELEMQNEELRRTQAELAESRTRYFDLYDLAPVGYCTISEKGLILEANLTAATMLGLTHRGALANLPFSQYIFKEDQEIYYRYRKQLFETDEPKPCELRMVKMDGTSFWACLETTAAKGTDGAPTYRMVISNITGRIETEKDLRKSQEQLRDAHRLAHIGIWNWNADTDTVIWTEELYRIAGLDPKTPAPTYAEHHHIYAPASWDRLKVAVEKALETGAPYQLELVLIRPDGATRMVNAFGGATHDKQGRTTGLYGTVQDITERKRIENERQIFQDRLTMAQEIAHVGSWEYNLETGEIWGSEEAIRIYGLSSETGEFPIDQIEACIPEREMVHQALLDLIEHEKAYDLEFVINPADGNKRKFIFSKAELIKDAKGKPVKVTGVIQDITERKQAEETLRESENEYRNIFDNAIEGIFLTTQEGRYRSINPAFAAMFGYDSPDEMKSAVTNIGEQLYVNQEDRKRLIDMLNLSEGMVRGFEVQLRRKDRSLFWVSINVRMVNREGEKSPCLEGTCLDITDRRQSEEALRELSSRLYTIVENLPDATFVIDTDGKVVAWNRAIERMTGILKEDMIGKGNYEYAIPFYGERRPIIIDLAFLTDEEFEKREYDAIHRSSNTLYGEVYVPKTYGGKGAYLSATASRLCDAAGNVTGAIECIRDISERKQTEEKLHEITGRLHLATASAKAGVWEWNLQTNGMIWDDRMLELYGLTHDNFPGGVEAWEQGLHPDDSSRAVEECQAALRGERDFDTEFRVRRPDGTVVHIKADGLVLRDEKGQPLRMIGLNTDITKRKQEQEEKAQLQGQLLQAQKMESVGRLAGGVAHDFNNKLGVIIGYTEMALDQVDPKLPLHADLEHIRTAANHAADLTRQLLAFARKQTVAPKVLDLNKTVTSMLKMLQRLIGENIHIHWQPDANLWPIKVDPSQIDQILTNLCINARDAISNFGKITIETGNIAFDSDYYAAYAGFLPGEYVLLAVSDNGCGMDKEALSYLFEPFYTTKVAGKGTGLGLATVYGIVSQNNGIIKVYSEPEKGTTFRIYLPRHVGKTGQPQTKGPLEADIRGHETILLVEDDQSILAMTTRMLEKQGYTVLSANTPGAAIRLALERSGEIHLLMTDVVMPEMNGRDLAKNLLSLYPHLKRLFMSGYTADVIAQHGVLDEGVYFIQKPFSIKDLAAKVREVLDLE